MHIHTVLSPCASREMTPPAIVREAAEKGIAMIAVCDHNTAGNVRAVVEAAAAAPGRPRRHCRHRDHHRGRSARPGLVPQPRGRVRRFRRGRRGPPALAAAGAADGAPPRLQLSASLSSSSWTPTGTRRGSRPGCWPRQAGSRCRRRWTSSTGTAGWRWPPTWTAGASACRGSSDSSRTDVPFDALEISAAGAARGRAADFAAHGLPLLSSSDCHFLEDIGTGFTVLEVAEPAFDEIAQSAGNGRGQGVRDCVRSACTSWT